jgi:(p)ppGpp synthase/HD superfamily hydrolase
MRKQSKTTANDGIVLDPKRAARKSSKKRTKEMATIEDAIAMAVDAHRGQTDKYGQPYIMHVLGVAGRCRSIEEKIVAFLHDVVEDTDATFDDLRAKGFSERIITAVDALTRHNRESYDSFVERIAPNPLSRAVKLADLEDNMDVRRSNRPMKPKDAERLEKYRKAWQYLAALHTASASEEE